MPLDVPAGLPIVVAAAVVLVAGLAELSKGRTRGDRTAITTPIVFVWRHKGF